MTITELSIENVKRLQAIRICPTTGKPVVITGDNGQGKSSILDSIELALTNVGLEDPIRHGAKRATVKLKMSGEDRTILVERVIRGGSQELKVTAEDGKPISSPQAFLNGLIGSIAFDPLEFVRMKPRDQADTLRRLVGVDVRPIDARKKQHYDERTVVNRHVDGLKAQLAAIPPVPAEVPDVEVSAAEYVKKRDAVIAAEQDVTGCRRVESELSNAKTALAERIDKGRKLLAQLEAEMVDAEKKLSVASENVEKSIARFNEQVNANGTPDALATAIASVDSVNAQVRLKQKRGDLTKAIDDHEQKAKLLTELQAECDAEKARLLASAKMPIEGMAFDEDGVTIGSVRFDQLSTGEQIRSSAMIAMASNPALKVVMIREGALVNQANMSMLCKMAEERGFQCWIERFQEVAGDTGIHIVDGSVAAVNGEVVK